MALVAAAFVLIVQVAASVRVAAMGNVLLDDRHSRQERQEVLRYILPVVPGSIYYALQSNILIWLAAYFGTEHQVADLGALGRLGHLFALFTFVSGSLMIIDPGQLVSASRPRAL